MRNVQASLGDLDFPCGDRPGWSTFVRFNKSMQGVDQYAHQMLTQLERMIEENLHQIHQAKVVMEKEGISSGMSGK